MRGRGGITQQHDVAVAPPLAQHAVKIEPRRAAQMAGIGHQSVAAERTCKNLFAGGNRLINAHAIEAGVTPGHFRTFDNEGRCVSVELIGMRPDPAVFSFFEYESECVIEILIGSKPDIFACAHINIGLKNIGMARTDARVYAVGRDDKVEATIGFEVLRFGLELELHTKCAGTILKDVQEPFAADAAKAVAGRGDDFIPVVHRYVVPIDELASNEFRALRVIGLKIVERLIGEHYAPAEGIVRSVAFDHDHVVRGIAAFQGNREIQPSRTTPKTDGTHHWLLHGFSPSAWRESQYITSLKHLDLKQLNMT